MNTHILVRESVKIGYTLVDAAHASLACHLKFKDGPAVVTVG